MDHYYLVDIISACYKMQNQKFNYLNYHRVGQPDMIVASPYHHWGGVNVTRTTIYDYGVI